jgi:hypothetical protein
LWAAVAIAALFGGWAAALGAGTQLRTRHRWAATVCAYPDAGTTQLCEWRRGPPLVGDSPVRGVWDGVGLRIRGAVGDDVVASARTEVPISAGRYRVSAKLSITGARPKLLRGDVRGDVPAAIKSPVSVALRAAGRVIARVVPPPSDGVGAEIAGVIDHVGGPLLLEIQVEPGSIGSIVETTAAIGARDALGAGVDGGVGDRMTVWMSQLLVERFQNL